MEGPMSGAHSRWQAQIVAWRDRLNVSDTYDVLGDRRSWRLCGLEKSKRVMSILNLALCEKMKGKAAKGRGKMTKKKAARGLVVDVSQNPCRNKFTTKQGMNHTLCTSTVQVHVGKRRLITPREMLYEQGHPTSVKLPADMPMSAVRRLAGEGMALPSLATCLWCQFLLRAHSMDR